MAIKRDCLDSIPLDAPVRNFCNLGSFTTLSLFGPKQGPMAATSGLQEQPRLEIFCRGLCLNIPDLTKSGAANGNRMVSVGLRLYGIEHRTTVVRRVRVTPGGADDCPIWGRASRAKVTHDGVWLYLVGREGWVRLDKRGDRHGVNSA